MAEEVVRERGTMSKSWLPSPGNKNSKQRSLEEEYTETHSRKRSRLSQESGEDIVVGEKEVRAPSVGHGELNDLGARMIPKELREIVDLTVSDGPLNYIFLFFLGVLDNDLQPFIENYAREHISLTDYRRLQRFVRTFVSRGVHQEDFDRVIEETSALKAKDAALSAQVKQLMAKAEDLEHMREKAYTEKSAVKVALAKMEAKNAATEAKAAALEAEKAALYAEIRLQKQDARVKEENCNGIWERAQSDKSAMEAKAASMAKRVAALEANEATLSSELILAKQKARAIEQDLTNIRESTQRDKSAMEAEVAGMEAKSLATEMKVAAMEAKEAELLTELKLAKQEASAKEQELTDIREKAQRDKSAMESEVAAMEAEVAGMEVKNLATEMKAAAMEANEAELLTELNLAKQEAIAKERELTDIRESAQRDKSAIEATVAGMEAKSLATEMKVAAMEAKEAELLTELKVAKQELIAKEQELTSIRESAQRDKSAMEAEVAAMEAKNFATETKAAAVEAKEAILHTELKLVKQEAIAKEQDLAEMRWRDYGAKEETRLKDVQICELRQEVKHVKSLLGSAQNEAHQQARFQEIKIAGLRQEINRVTNLLALANDEIHRLAADLNVEKVSWFKDDLKSFPYATLTPNTSVLEILTLLKDKTSESVRQVTLVALKTRLHDLRNEAHSLRNRHEVQMEYRKQRLHSMEQEFAHMRRKGRAVEEESRLSALQFSLSEEQSVLKHEIVSEDYQVRRQSYLFGHMDMTKNKLQDFQGELFSPILEDFKATKTTFKTVLDAKKAHLKILREMDAKLREQGRWVQEQLARRRSGW